MTNKNTQFEFYFQLTIKSQPPLRWIFQLRRKALFLGGRKERSITKVSEFPFHLTTIPLRDFYPEKAGNRKLREKV